MGERDGGEAHWRVEAEKGVGGRQDAGGQEKSGGQNGVGKQGKEWRPKRGSGG